MGNGFRPTDFLHVQPKNPFSSVLVRVPFAGAALRPHASLMRREGVLTEQGQAVLEAAQKAGYELVKEGRISQETLDAISRPLIPEDDLRVSVSRWGLVPGVGV